MRSQDPTTMDFPSGLHATQETIPSLLNRISSLFVATSRIRVQSSGSRKLVTHMARWVPAGFQASPLILQNRMGITRRSSAPVPGSRRRTSLSCEATASFVDVGFQATWLTMYPPLNAR
eukprot:CAMPEP_0115662562 /NCGR_PEP_ID=MMETSP0272-20121206/47383_1 /TAXON_ID=71861 /ORGANISM="Scrippsiella trochoidea, Strain CCMP3099" /LENGTH=118 /DNA_ID=CAMNT_0003100871 /DNA_START=245 /DNA_END=597 /DNA_ORIENTATION=-